MWTKTADGSIVDSKGKVIFFSTERFVRDICLGDCCFICGASPRDKAFNNEHILPKWVLARFNLFSRKIALPNDADARYGSYTIPCCADCNAIMGTVLEQPVSQVLSAGGINAVHKFVSGAPMNMFVWMGLIYLKTHLKDRAHRVHLDTRKGSEKIADEYEWEHLHHVHCLVRCFYSGCFAAPEALGSFLALPVERNTTDDPFDFADLYLAQTMLLRIDDVGLVAVFNDSGAAMNFFWQKLQKITAPVSELQLREIMAEFAFLNLHLKERPEFLSDIDIVREQCTMIARRPALALALAPLDPTVRGRLMYHALRDALPLIRVPGRTPEDIVAGIKAGSFSSLFNDKGEFIDQASQQK